MWARKRIDICWLDLLLGATYTLSPQSIDAAQSVTERAWSIDGNVLACFTERTAFDLLLTAMQLPPGGEVLMSAVTIDDMARIIRQHRLVPVPVDVDQRDMSPTLAAFEAAWTPQSVAILVAHLFGGRSELGEIADWAHARGLHIWEDCAQAYEGPRFRGDEKSDVVMFSFGPIKTNTALGGGLVRVRDRELLARMRQLHAQYPSQSRWSFLKRIAQYSLIKAVEGPRRFRLLIELCRQLNIDYDRALSAAVRNLPGDDFLHSLRRRPSVPLLRLLTHRLLTFHTDDLHDRRRKGTMLANLLRDRLCCPGADAAEHSYWVFPVEVPDRESFTLHLRAAGFDAAATSAMRPVSPPSDRPQRTAEVAQSVIDRVIYVPLYREMPDNEIKRMARVLLTKCDAYENSLVDAAHAP